MSVQSDKWIIQMARENDMISPFKDKQVRGDKISFGVSSYGYDARVSDEFKIFTNVNSEIVDPKNFKSSNFITKNSSERYSANSLKSFEFLVSPCMHKIGCADELPYVL